MVAQHFQRNFLARLGQGYAIMFLVIYQIELVQPLNHPCDGGGFNLPRFGEARRTNRAFLLS